MILRSCPPDYHLQNYLLGKIFPDEAVSLEEHLVLCARCQERIDVYDCITDSFQTDLREITQSGIALDDPELDRLVTDAIAHAVALGTVCQEKRQLPCELGRYRLLKLLGEGGFGQVYLAEALLLGRMVAIKLLKKIRHENQLARQRFLQEMLAIGRLPQHDHLVQAHHADVDDGQMYLVMEYVDGVSLSMLLQIHGPLRTADACEIARQTALGLQHIHEHHLAHRDIKPGNLLVSTNGRVKVLDLGLARLMDLIESDARLTGSECHMGTRGFMAPEQAIDGSLADIRSDIYSLGCTLYRSLTGCLPIRTVLPDPLNSVRAQSPQLAAVVERMLAPRPEERFQTPNEVAAALQSFCSEANLIGLLDASTSHAGRIIPVPSKPEHSQSTRSRTWRLQGGVGLVIAIVGILLFGILILHFRQATVFGPIAAMTRYSDPVVGVALAPDGQRAAISNGRRIWTMDLPRQRLLAEWDLPQRSLQDAGPVFTADGRIVVVGLNRSFERAEVCYYDVLQGQLQDTHSVVGILSTLATAPTGNRTLLGMGSGRLESWPPGIQQDFGSTAPPLCAAVATDSCFMVAGCADRTLRATRADHSDDDSCVLRESGRPLAVTLSPDGETVYVVIGGVEPALRAWDRRTRKVLHHLPLSQRGEITAAAFSGNARIAATAHMDGSLGVWDLIGWRSLATYSAQPGPATVIAVDYLGTHAISGGADGVVWWYRLPGTL